MIAGTVPRERPGFLDRLTSIVVGIDFSPASATALAQGLRLAEWNRAKLRAVHVIDTLVVVEHEPFDGLVEAAELVQKLAAAFRMELDLRELVVVERPRLLEDGIGHRQLPHVVQQAADREAPQTAG